MKSERPPLLTPTETDAVAEMRRQLEAIFEGNNALYMTGDNYGNQPMYGFWNKKPKIGSDMGFWNGVEAIHFENAVEDDVGKEGYDVPWCIDLCSGEMELPTLGLKLPLEEWALM